MEVLEVIRCVLLCMVEAMEGELSLLEVREVTKVPEGPEVMRCVLLYALRNERSCMHPPPSIFAQSKNWLLVTRLHVALAPCCGPGGVEV